MLKIFKSFVSNISWNNLFFLKVFSVELTFWTWKKKSSFYYSLFDLWFALHSPVFSTVLYRKKCHANVILNPFLFKNPVFTLPENFKTLFSGVIKGNMMKIRYSVTEFVVPPDVWLSLRNWHLASFGITQCTQVIMDMSYKFYLD